MIFVTVGSMFPFDRLIRAMDEWARAAGPSQVLAQIGDGSFTPSHMRWVRRLERGAFEDMVTRAELVVAHAGIGSVLTARTAGTPIVLLPRRSAFGEHTSDHQVETARSLRDRKGIFVAETETQLAETLTAAQADAGAGLPPAARPHGGADPVFLARIRNFIDGDAESRAAGRRTGAGP